MPLPKVLLAEDVDATEPDELARRALTGCVDSFAELARYFRPRLVQLLQHRLGGHWADAEDLAQDTLARAFQQISRFDPRYRFSTWVYTIAFRLASDHARSQRRFRRHVSFDGDVHGVCSDPAEHTVDQTDTIGSVWSTAQECLVPNQFTALWLRYGEDLSLTEIARVMGKTQVGVRVLLHRARVRLIRQCSNTDSSPAESSTSRLPSGIQP